MNQFGAGGEKAVSRRLRETDRCTKCSVRWKQSALGLCRRCERELGIADREQERDRRHVEKQAERLRAAYNRHTTPQARAAHASIERRPRRLVIHPTIGIDELDYFVVWAGDMDGARAMGLPLGNEKRASYTGGRERWSTEQKGAGLRRSDFGNDC